MKDTALFYIRVSIDDARRLVYRLVDGRKWFSCGIAPGSENYIVSVSHFFQEHLLQTATDATILEQGILDI